MTVASLQDAPLSLISVGCGSEHLFSTSLGDTQFSIVAPSGSMSFDWSDFPVLSQYNEDMPVPPPAPLASSVHYSASPLRSCSRACSWREPVLLWHSNDDDVSSSFSISSDEETVVETRSKTTKTKDVTKKSVTFSDVVEIRSHKVVLGVHPCCSSLALQLGWEHEETEVLDFDVYETSRSYQRRHLHALRMSYWDRRRMLEKSTGLSEEELLLQEQLAWREQLDVRVFGEEVITSSKFSSHSDAQFAMKKVSSLKVLPCLTP